jgi:hypothetical protein
VTARSQNRSAWVFLGIAIAVSIVFAIPMEQLTQEPPPLVFLHSCDRTIPMLYLGNTVQAILTPIFVFLLPWPGSILPRKFFSTSSLRASHARMPSGVRTEKLPALFIGTGWMFALAVSVAWWYGLQKYAGLHGACGELFDSSHPAGPFRVDYVADCFRYFIYLSGSTALWAGITAGGLRLQSSRAAGGDAAGNTLHQFEGFYWACFLGWGVQYRINQWIAIHAASPNQDWTMFAALNFCFVTVSSLWVLAFTRSLWNKKPRTWLQAFLHAVGISLLVYLLTVLTFFWLVIYAVLPVVPAITSWYVFGLAWALFVGTWRWRIPQKP